MCARTTTGWPSARRFLALGFVMGHALACTSGGSTEPDAGVEPGFVVEVPVEGIETLMDVVVLSPTRAYAVGSAGTILRYADEEWTSDESPTDVLLRSVSGVRNEEADEEVVVAVGDEGTVLLREADGWVVLDAATTYALFDVWVRAPNDGFIVGESGTILRFTGIEVVSMADESLQTRYVTGPVCQGAGDCGPGETCAPRASDPGGLSICQDPNHPEGLIVEEFGIPESLKTVAGTGAEDVLAAGPSGALYFFDGFRWYPEDSGTSRSISHLYRGAGTWATANDGVIMIRQGPSDWDTQTFRAPVPVFLQGLWGVGGNDFFAVGLAGAIYHRIDGEWETTRFDDDFHLRAVDGVVVAPATEEEPMEQLVFAVGAAGRIVRGPLALPR